MNRGYSEEMVRISNRLFRAIDWAAACSLYKDFDMVFCFSLEAMTQLGHNATSDLLDKYENGIPGKSAQYILLCNLRCYNLWYARDYSGAIRWGEEGEALKSSTAVDTAFSTRHNLALARRDDGLVSEALESFLEGEPLEVVIAPGKRVEGKGANYYGNIGRCLFLKGDLEEAAVCLVKSAKLLEDGRREANRLNKGYIRWWMAELLVLEESFEFATAFFRAAECMWSVSSPPRAMQVRARANEVFPEGSDHFHELEMECWKAEEEFRAWLAGH